MKKITKGLALSGVAAVTALGFSVGAAAQSDMTQSTMQEINGSGASGTAWITLKNDNMATFKVNMSGVTAGMPHAQHVHFGNTTESDSGPIFPTPDAADDFTEDNTTTAQEGLGDGEAPNTAEEPGVDTANSQAVPGGSQINYDEYINTLEGKPYYGDVQISLTTEGDTSASSGLATDRFPTGNDSGAYNYERTIELTDEQVQNVKAGDVEIVVHGGDFWAPGDPEGSDGSILSYTYDSNADGDDSAVAAADVYPKSPLATALGAGPLPLEATMPVAVGEFSAVPTGSVDTGLGTQATQMSYALIAGGSALAIAATGTGLLYIRRRGEV